MELGISLQTFDSRSSGGGVIILDYILGSKPGLGSVSPSDAAGVPPAVARVLANPGEPGAFGSVSGPEGANTLLPLSAQGPGARDPEGCSGTHVGKQAGRKPAKQGAKLTGSPPLSRGHVGPELGQPL